jgi:hypothetical protein
MPLKKGRKYEHFKSKAAYGKYVVIAGKKHRVRKNGSR